MRISDWSSDVCSSDLFAKLIRGDPADEPGPASQRGYACRSIRRRTARRFPARRHASIEPCRPLCVDQPHGALDQPFGAEERLLGGCDHLDDGIADTQDIPRRMGHWQHSLLTTWKAPLLTDPTTS